MSWSTIQYLGAYRLLNVVNVGQTSLVWKAHHDELRRLFAIKTLQEKYVKDKEHVGYLRWEYSVGKKLDDQRIIRFQSEGTDRGTPYLVMEWFAAGNLKQLIRPGLDRTGHLVPKVVVQAAEAVAYFNEQGWVHRDIKPENFMVSKSGTVKLIDFALAQRAASGLGKLLARKSKVQGTRSYMSPEQIRGEPLDSRADMYCLACSLFELATGRPPYTGVSANDLLVQHLKAAPPLLESLNRNVTADFSRLIRQALAKKAAKRPDSTREFLNELKSIRVFKRNYDPPEDYNEAEAEGTGEEKG